MDTSETYKNSIVNPLEPTDRVETVVLKWYEDPIYIKMCKKAKEIQPIFEEDDSVGGTLIGGNLICHHQSNWEKEHNKAPDGLYWIMEESYIDACETCGNEEDKNKVIKTVWLPRQDQLQTMVTSQDLADYEVIRPDEPPLIDNLLPAFYSFCNRQPWMGRADGIDNRPSMEQLWLAFVMKEKYNKVWNGDEWTE